jgi:two-component system cell cycle response regulator
MKILIAEDDPIYCRILESVLTGWNYQPQVVHDGITALNILRQADGPRMAILDWMMPGMDGIDVCRELRLSKQDSYTYLLLLTSRNQKSDLITGLQSGADDYLLKPFDPAELQARLFTGRRIMEVQEQLIAAREAMRYQATHDHLTGAWNHRAIIEAAQREMNRVWREGGTVGLILADLDHFKKINDTYGHLAGDMVLRETASRMMSVARPYDLIGRYGGEEFLILLPGCDATNTMSFAERLRERIGSQPYAYQQEQIRVTLSQGAISIQGGGKMDSVQTILDAADMALYRAKNNGRNRVEMARPLQEGSTVKP